MTESLQFEVGAGAAARPIAVIRREGAGPGLFWLGGFRSDMTGTKAEALDRLAAEQGVAATRFDYSGHGASGGAFVEGTISRWLEEAEAAFDRFTREPQILVGSSMGGWIALLLAKRLRSISGLIGVAAAPDFTEDLMWARFTDGQRRDLEDQGYVTERSAYSDVPDLITKRLIEDGRQHLVLRKPLRLGMPVRLLHGTADEDVPVQVALTLLGHAECSDMHLTLVKGADHRFSSPVCLNMVVEAIAVVSGARNIA